MTDGHVFMTHAYGYCVLLCWVYISERLLYSCLSGFTCENRLGSGVSVLGAFRHSIAEHGHGVALIPFVAFI